MFVNCVGEESFEEAKKYCAVFRPQARVANNAKRAKNHPVPPNLLLPNVRYMVDGENSETNRDNGIVDNLNCVNEAAVANIENKPALLPVQMDENDVTAMEALMNEERNDVENTENDDGETSVQNNGAENIDSSIDLNTEIRSNVPDFNDDSSNSSNADNELKITEAIGEIEMTYFVGQKFQPKIVSTPMPMKVYDVLSGNMPYQGICDRNDVCLCFLTICFFHLSNLYFFSMICGYYFQ